VRVEREYAVAPGVLLGLLTDPAFLTARSERYGGVGVPTVRRTAAEIVVTATRQLPLEHVPSAFRRFVGTGRVVQTDTWTGAVGLWTLDTGSAPIRLRGTHEVIAVGGGCRYTVTGDVRVTLPVLAGRMTRRVETHLTELVRAEQEFAAEWLTGMMSGREGVRHG
jgi:Protein of unknown function (DUF2505)